MTLILEDQKTIMYRSVPLKAAYTSESLGKLFETIPIPDSHHPHILIHLEWVLDIGMFKSWTNNSNIQ